MLVVLALDSADAATTILKGIKDEDSAAAVLVAVPEEAEIITTISAPEKEETVIHTREIQESHYGLNQGGGGYRGGGNWYCEDCGRRNCYNEEYKDYDDDNYDINDQHGGGGGQYKDRRVRFGRR